MATMKKILAFVFFLKHLTKGVFLPASNESLEWEVWKNTHGRSYNNKNEESFRRAVWMQNLKKIENRKLENSFAMEMNNLADLTEDEYRHLMLGKKIRILKAVVNGSTFLRPSDMSLPENVDWRKTGCVGNVENQDYAGSWSISAIGSLEGQYCIPRRHFISLSEKKLQECCFTCIRVDDAFNYMIDHNHIDDNYDDNCNFSAAEFGASLAGYVDIPRGSEPYLQYATAKIGPISVTIDASHASFQLYVSGIYDEPACSSFQLDHAVLVVGYGSLNGTDYWLVKNSWGVAWGMHGYIMMARNKGNQCGIASLASYPTEVTGEVRTFENNAGYLIEN